MWRSDVRSRAGAGGQLVRVAVIMGSMAHRHLPVAKQAANVLSDDLSETCGRTDPSVLIMDHYGSWILRLLLAAGQRGSHAAHAANGGRVASGATSGASYCHWRHGTRRIGVRCCDSDAPQPGLHGMARGTQR
jgi:hypothetical protein